MIPPRRNIRRTFWYLFLIFFILILGVMAGGYLYYSSEKRHIEQDEGRELSAIADLKVGELSIWRKKRKEEARAIFENPFLGLIIERWMKDGATLEAGQEAAAWMSYLRKVHDYDNLHILDERATVRLTVPDRKQPAGTEVKRAALEAIRKRQVILSDLARDENSGRIHLDLFVPVSAKPDMRPIGVLLLRIDPYEYLYPLIQSWPTPSPSAETVLIRREGDNVVFLNELRHRKGTALALKLSLSSERLPAAMAARGIQGVVKGIDYRGVPVLAVLRAVPDSPWFVVAKIDLAEVYAPMRERAWIAIILGGVFIISAGISIILLWRHQRLQLALEQSQAELQVEAALARLRRRNALILTSAGDGIFGLDPQGNYTFVNPAAAKMLRYETEELVGKHGHTVCHHSKAGGGPYLEEECPIYAAYRDGSIHHVVDEYFWRKDGTGFPVEYTSTPIMDNGKLTGAVVTFKDVTERKQIEEERIKAGKLESIGILAGGIAHDFNNILTAVLGNITLARLNSKQGDRAYGLLMEAEKASIKAKSLTQQLLTFARGGAPVRKVMPITMLIKEAAAFAARGSGTQCVFFIPDDLRAVDVDEGQIRQVVTNLVLNAVQAMPEGGTVEVQAENTIVSPGDLLLLRPGEYVKVSVKDHGIGIPKEYLSKIFDPYFTTKQKGTGLGLTICYSIVRNHGGYIGVESETGVGTTVYFYLPAVQTGTVTLEEFEEEIPLDHARVLVMDDEKMVREVAEQMLSHIGYEVDLAQDGVEAVDLYNKARQAGRPFDAVILDLTNPGGMGGKEAAGKILEIDPAAKLIVSSGYSSDPIVTQFGEYGFKGVVVKPYRLGELAKVLHRLLKGKGKP